MFAGFLLRHLRLTGVCYSFRDVRHCRSWQGASATAADSQAEKHSAVDTRSDVHPAHFFVDEPLPEFERGVLGPKLEDSLRIVHPPGVFNLFHEPRDRILPVLYSLRDLLSRLPLGFEDVRRDYILERLILKYMLIKQGYPRFIFLRSTQKHVKTTDEAFIS